MQTEIRDRKISPKHKETDPYFPVPIFLSAPAPQTSSPNSFTDYSETASSCVFPRLQKLTTLLSLQRELRVFDRRALAEGFRGGRLAEMGGEFALAIGGARSVARAVVHVPALLRSSEANPRNCAR